MHCNHPPLILTEGNGSPCIFTDMDSWQKKHTLTKKTAWRAHIWKEICIVYIHLSLLLPLITNFYFSLVRYLFFLISPTGCDTEKKGQESAVAAAADAIGMK